MKKSHFKSLVDKKVNKFAFQALKSEGLTRSKSSNIVTSMTSNKLLTQQYIKTNKLTKSQVILLFNLRSKCCDVKTNFRNQFKEDMSCRCCKEEDSIEDEDHLLDCKMLRSEVEDYDVTFDHVFSTLEKQINAVKVFEKVMRKRDLILEVSSKR